MNQTPPDAELKDGHDSAALYRNFVLKYGTNQTTCDRMIVEHAKGNTEDVVIYGPRGKRTVRRLRQQFEVVQGSVTSTAAFSNFVEVEEVGGTDKQKLLAVYNKLLEIADSKPK